MSSQDAALLNGRYSHGQGLLRSGSSINNVLAGDAEKSILTAANFMGVSFLPESRSVC